MDADLVAPARLEAALGRVVIRPWRIHLETPGVEATTPMLRGVWGKALRELSPPVYETLFGEGPNRLPRYWFRPAPPDAEPAPAIEFALFGTHDPVETDVAWAAWERAARAGLGPRRIPFRLNAARPLAWDGVAMAPSRVQPGFPLAGLPRPPDGPLRIEAPAPLRLLRARTLIERPTLADLVLAALTRLKTLLGPDPQADALWSDRFHWLDQARRVPSLPWTGRRLDLVRYSGARRQEIDLRGVTGSLELPRGVEPALVPLMAATPWLHLGKGTVFGLGQIRLATPSEPHNR